MENRNTGRRTKIHYEGGQYIFYVWVPAAAGEVKKVKKDTSNANNKYAILAAKEQPGETAGFHPAGRGVESQGGGDCTEAVSPEGHDEEEGPVSNVYECSQCGFTLFVATGRESKFYGDSFTCPECGAPKDKFMARDDVEE